MADIRTFAAAAAPGSAGRATDERLLNDLLELLSRLEQNRAQLEERFGSHPDPAAVARVTDLVNTVIEFVKARSTDQTLLPSRVLASVADALPYTQLLGEEQERISVSTIVAALNDWKGDAREQRVLIRDLCEAAVDLLAVYCQGIAALFRLDRDRDEWKTMSDLFVADLRNTFRQVS